MNRKVLVLLLCACVGIAVSLAMPINVSALSNGGIGILPANPNDAVPGSDQTFTYTIEPGGRVYDEVEISNTTDSDVDVLVYATDPIFNNDGQLSCKQYVERKEKEGSWIQVDGENYILGPKQKRRVKFMVTVPQNVDVGEHNACVVLQKRDNRLSAESQDGIALRIRIALRVKINIPGQVEKSVAMTKFEHVIREQRSDLDTVLENSGNVSVGGEFETYTRLFGIIPVHSIKENITVLRSAKLIKTTSRTKPFYGGLYFSTVRFAFDDGTGAEQVKSAAIWYWIWPEWWFILLVAAGIGGIIYMKSKDKKDNTSIRKVKLKINKWGKVSKKKK